MSPSQSTQTPELLAGMLPGQEKRMLLNLQASLPGTRCRILQKDNGRKRERRDGGTGKHWKWKTILQA